MSEDQSPVAWIAKARWERMTAAEAWLTNTVYSEDQKPHFTCVPLYAAGKSFEDGVRAAADLFITDPREPVDDMTKLIREASRQKILSLIVGSPSSISALSTTNTTLDEQERAA